MLLAICVVAATCLSGISAMVFATDKHDTNVMKIEIANDAMVFYLSQNDYTNKADPNNQSAASFTDYNYWENIRIYTDESTSKTLKEAYENRADEGKTTFYNLWTRWYNYAVSIDQESLDKGNKVVIPAGTEFPSYAYTTGAISDKTSYVTTEEVIFVKEGSDWKRQEKVSNANTEVTKIDIINQTFCFFLSEHDYQEDPNNTSATAYTDYNYWENILIYTGETSKTLKDAYANRANIGNTTFYNLWTNWGTFAVSIDQNSLDQATKVVIPEGTQFPSYAYTTGASTIRKNYVTTEETIFIKGTDGWAKESTGGGSVEELNSTPANGEEVSLLAGGIYDFVKNYQKATSEEYATKGDCYAPAGVTFTWSQVSGAKEYVLELSNSESMLEPKTYTTATNSLEIKDLLAGKKYFYRIKVKKGNSYQTSKTFAFQTAQLPRTISIDAVSNTRDLGGYLTTDGKYRVRQGMVYRGANIDNISAAGKETFLQTYKIRTDLDVRGDKRRSPLGDEVNYVSAVGPQYVQAFDKSYKEALATEIRTFADPANYPIYFHCQIGRDRTGTLAFLINGLLGVSEKDLYLDYELSMFSSAGWADNSPVNALVNQQFATLVKEMKDYKNGSLKENIEAFVKTELGITQTEIDTIRALLLEDAEHAISYDTEITKIQVRADKLLVFPKNMDYQEVPHSTMANAKVNGYSLFDKIILYKSATEKATLSEVYQGHAWYNVWETENSIAFDLKEGWDGTTIKKVEFLPGLPLPAYHYTDGTDTVKTSYVMKNKIVFTTNTSNETNIDWVAEDTSTPDKTTVSAIRTGHNGKIMTFTLSNTDYAGLATASVGNKHTAYNYLEQIKVYLDGDQCLSLKEAYVAGGETYYNMWGIENTYSLTLQEDVMEKVTKIVIPAGTVFPSSKYTADKTNQKTGYQVSEEVIFTKPASGEYWKVQDTSTPEETSMVNLLSGHNATILTFYLSHTDYENQNIGDSHTDYNYLDQIKIYTGEDTFVTLKTALKAGGQMYYNMWGRANTLSLEIHPSVYRKMKKVVIPTGTVFPSYAHTNGGEAFCYGYETKKENSFAKPTNATEGGEGYYWTSLNPAIERETVIKNLQIRDTSSKIIFYLSENDYAQVGTNVSIGSLLEAGNLLQKVVLYRSDGTSKTLAEVYTGESYYNLWNEQNCIGLDLIDDWNGTNIEKVVIQADCEFPCYAYTSGAIYDKTFYVSKYETVFTATAMPENGYDNVFYQQSMVIPSQAVSTTVTKATILGASKDMRLILQLNMQDYAEAEDSEAVGRRYLDYNTLSKISLYKGNQKVSLADAINTEEVYYNLWGRTGTVSYGLKAKYTVNSFDKIRIQSGCEFPACSYTQTDSTTKVAYTVTTQKDVKLSKETHKVSYYDANNKLLYTDNVVSGTPLTLRKAPKKAGYAASWSGTNYTLMPAEDISYVLTYETYKAITNEKEDTTDPADAKDTEDGKEEGKASPTTGDTFAAYKWLLLLLISGAVIVGAVVVRKKVRKGKLDKKV